MSADIYLSKKIYLDDYNKASKARAEIAKIAAELLGKPVDILRRYDFFVLSFDVAHWRGYGLADWFESQGYGDGQDIDEGTLCNLVDDLNKGNISGIEADEAAGIVADIEQILKDFSGNEFRVTIWC